MIGLLIFAAVAQPTATARAETSEVTLGDTFQVTVEAVHDAGLTLNLPPSLDLGAALSEENRVASSKDNGDGTVTSSWALSIGAYDVGDHEIPEIPVTFVVDGAANSVTTRPIPIHVASYVGEGEEELRPIAGPVAVTRPDWTVIWVLGVLGGTVVLFLIALLLRYMWRRRTVAPARAEAAAQTPADEEALARLVELERSGALEAEDLEPAYTSLSEIVRAYLGRRFEFPALDLTTEEIHRDLELRADTRELAGELRAWFDTCDVVKFADYPSSPDEARAALYQARQIVQKSTPKRVPEVAADG